MSERRRASAGAVAALVLILIGAAAWAVVVKSPLFDLRDVRVLGAGRVSPEEIVGLLEIEEGANLLFLSMDEVASSLRQAPWFSDVTVGRELPSTLVIRVRERVPVAWVPGPKGGAAVAADGTVLALRKHPRSLVRVGRSAARLRPGAATQAISAELRVIGSLPPALRREVARATRRGDQVVLHLRSGAKVRYGAPQALAQKRAALESLLDWVRREGIEAAYLDVRAPATPAILPARPTITSAWEETASVDADVPAG